MRVAGTDLELDQIAADEIAVGDAIAGGAAGCVVRRVASTERKGHLIDVELEMPASRHTTKVHMS